jgi:hypothetical protein
MSTVPLEELQWNVGALEVHAKGTPVLTALVWI